jgi:hypothetical protein
MLGGLVFQVVTLAVFSALCLEFGWRVRTRAATLNANTYQIRQRWQWKAFLVGIFVFISDFHFREIEFITQD